MTFTELSKIIEEAKQVGIVYHFTNLYSLKSLLKSKNHKGLACDIFGFGSHNHHFSTTRNFNITNTFYNNDFPFKEYNIRIAFDGDKLSNDYKVKPIAGLTTSDKEVFGIDKNLHRVTRDKGEAEEIVCPKILKGEAQIFWLKKYIIEVSIQQNSASLEEQEEFKLLQKILSKHKINSKISRKFQVLKDSEYTLNEINKNKCFIVEHI